MVIYLRVFNFLWRAKRMEYILAGIWKGQMTNSRMLKSVPGIVTIQFAQLPYLIVDVPEKYTQKKTSASIVLCMLYDVI